MSNIASRFSQQRVATTEAAVDETVLKKEKHDERSVYACYKTTFLSISIIFFWSVDC